MLLSDIPDTGTQIPSPDVMAPEESADASAMLCEDKLPALGSPVLLVGVNAVLPTIPVDADL